MRVVFLGTPEFAVPSLERLLDSGHEVGAVVTQPPRPAGRGRRIRASAVARVARDRQLELFELERLKGFELTLRAIAPELLVVVAFGRILSRTLLEAAPGGALNVHASLLPRWRGAAPIARAILAGDELTGVCTMQLDEGMDTGPLYLTREEPIRGDDTTATLGARLAEIGADLLMETLDGLSGDRLKPHPQSDQGVMLAPRIRAEEGLIDWSQDARQLALKVRAFNPWPSAHTSQAGKRLKLLGARAFAASAAEPPGSVTDTTPEGFVVSCGTGTLLVLQAQLAGKPARPARDLVNGRLVARGDRLGR